MPLALEEEPPEETIQSDDHVTAPRKPFGNLPTLPNTAAVQPAGRVILIDEKSAQWCFVRLIEVKDDVFVSIEAQQALTFGEIAMVPSVCAATNLAELDELIAALTRVRGKMIERGNL